MIEPVVEARVEAAIAEEHAVEATEVAEAALERAEAAVDIASVESQWTNERISNLETTMMEGLSSLQSSVSELSQQLNLLQAVEPSSSTLTEETTEETAELTAEVAEVLAENPEIEGAVIATTNTSETQTEPSSETSTEVPEENVAVVVLQQASSAAPKRVLKARLI